MSSQLRVAIRLKQISIHPLIEREDEKQKGQQSGHPVALDGAPAHVPGLGSTRAMFGYALLKGFAERESKDNREWKDRKRFKDCLPHILPHVEIRKLRRQRTYCLPVEKACSSSESS
jgi:hypothetical protein